MLRKTPQKDLWLSKGFFFLVWTVIFSLAYTQSPLYTSNQNTYYLHGLAQAGFGYLRQDWLANTADPTPVFSLLVEWTFRYLGWEGIFYILYALLMGIYFYSILGILSTVFDLSKTPAARLALLSLLVLMHSAALRFAISRVMGINWTFILEDGVADQRILGLVFQPSAFGVFLMLSIYLFLKERSHLAVLTAALAAIFHPTYLLAAATLTLTYITVDLKEKKQPVKTLSVALLAFLAVLPILYYTYTSFWATSGEGITTARQILVEVRLPHHAMVARWMDATAVIKILLVCLGMYLVKKSRLSFVMLASFTLAAILTLLQVWLGEHTLALLFPWRLSIYLVPLSTGIILASFITKVSNLPGMQSPRLQKWIYNFSVGLVLACILVGAIRLVLDFENKRNIPEREIFDYVYTHSASDEIYLIPVKMQDFRLATGASTFVDFKSSPYKDSEVLEWNRRLQLAERFYQSPDCQTLHTLAASEDITHLILESDTIIPDCPNLHQVYEDPHYSLFAIQAP